MYLVPGIAAVLCRVFACIVANVAGHRRRLYLLLRVHVQRKVVLGLCKDEGFSCEGVSVKVSV